METQALFSLGTALPAAIPQVQDTIVALTPVSTLLVLSEIADLLLAVGLFLVLLFLLLVGRRIARLGTELEDALRGYRTDLAPVFDRSRVVAENVEYVSRVVRGDVERLQASVDALGAKLSAATHEMEDRIQEFNMLLGVVQGEAEDLFLDTAATVKGVQTGARELTAGRRSSRTSAPSSPDPTLDDDDEA